MVDDLSNVFKSLKDMQRRIRRLESTLMLQNAAISEGGLRVISSDPGLVVEGLLQVTGIELIDGQLKITGTLSTTGDTDIGGDVTISGDTDVTGKLNVTGDTTLGGDTEITGDVSLKSDLDVASGGKITVGDMTFEIDGGVGKITMGGASIYVASGVVQIIPATGPGLSLGGAQGARLFPLDTTDAATHPANVWMNPTGQMYRTV
ncbi:hypothetical protein [Microbacterium sp. KR10-403]|uniref:hypothetical protein n=1 Tax=Microbacterium sp. KR10-403 TaxID=3158581 RepID=UPI0032E4CB00